MSSQFADREDSSFSKRYKRRFGKPPRNDRSKAISLIHYLIPVMHEFITQLEQILDVRPPSQQSKIHLKRTEHLTEVLGSGQLLDDHVPDLPFGRESAIVAFHAKLVNASSAVAQPTTAIDAAAKPSSVGYPRNERSLWPSSLSWRTILERPDAIL